MKSIALAAIGVAVLGLSACAGGYYDRYDRYGYYDRGYYDAPRYRGYAYDDGYRRHCRVVRENINGHIRKVRRCW